MVDNEFIRNWRNMLKPSISSWLLKTNYEGKGEQDKEEFERDFDEILDLALIGLKYKTQLSKENTTSDLISRTETVKQLQGVLDVTVPITDYDEGYVDGVEVGISTVSTMPPIQPVATDTNVGDTISRQAALEKVRTMQTYKLFADISLVDKAEVQTELMMLPPAQPEALTDKEQRLFLAAMGREEKVCRQVDDECRDCREPYEDSLVRTCHEITRKVKGALWT